MRERVGKARRGALSSCTMVHLVILCCAGASVAPQLAAELVQASIFVLIEATQAVRPASSPLPHRGRQLPGPFACVRCTAQTSCSRRLSHRVTDFCVSLRWCLWWCAVCPRGRSEWGSASAVTFHRPCMVMGGVWKHSERPRSAAATARAQGSSWRAQPVLRTTPFQRCSTEM